jgi:hypothetical protein
MEAKRRYESRTAAEVVAMWDRGVFALWKDNRAISEKRVARIAAEVNQSANFGPSPIVIGRVGESLHVVDGQHRLRATKLLDPATANRTTLCICWETCRNESELLALFRIVNCGTPVAPSHWNSDVDMFIRELIQAIKTHWGDEVFSKASKAIRPRITEDALRSVIDNCRGTREAAAVHCLSVPGALETMIAMNTAAERLFGGGGKSAVMAGHDVSHAMLGVASKLSFFVGLRKKWLENFVLQLADEWVVAGAGD